MRKFRKLHAFSIRILLPILGSGAVALTTFAQDQNPEPAYLSDMVSARKALMSQIETVTSEAEALQTNAPEELLANAARTGELLSAAFQAFPHLFPPSSSQQALTDAGIDTSTSAAPAIWEDFEAFYRMAQTAQGQAMELSEATRAADAGQSLADLRSTCEGCHAQFLYYDPMEALGITLPTDD